MVLCGHYEKGKCLLKKETYSNLKPSCFAAVKNMPDCDVTRYLADK